MILNFYYNTGTSTKFNLPSRGYIIVETIQCVVINLVEVAQNQNLTALPFSGLGSIQDFLEDTL